MDGRVRGLRARVDRARSTRDARHALRTQGRAQAPYEREASDKKRPADRLASHLHGADNGTRTRDPNLGKVVLYQLSHVRMEETPGFEPGVKALQASALPLGYVSGCKGPAHRPCETEWSGQRDSNPRPQPWQGCALPTEPCPQREKLLYPNRTGRASKWQNLTGPPGSSTVHSYGTTRSP